MLRYSVKPSADYELSSFPIRELFVSPDLSYISGVTDINVGLVNGENILIKSPYLIGNEIDTINTKIVRRQGKVEVEIEIPVKKIEYTLNFPIHSDMGGESYILAFNKKIPVTSEGDYVLSSVTQSYVEYKGDICYFFNGTGGTKGYLIDHKFYTATTSTTSVKITSYVYIEDGELVIGNYTYYADFSNNGNEPILRLNKYSNPIHPDSQNPIGLIEGYKCKFKSIKEYEPSDWVRVCKFFIEKHENPAFEVEDALYGGYKHYISFNDENYYLRDVYQYDDKQNETVYKGYGITLDGEFCEAFPNYDSEIKGIYHDLPFNGGYVYVEKSDEYLEIYDSLINPVNGGSFIFLIGIEENSDIIPGNFIIAESNSSIELNRVVNTDYNGNDYITFCGNKYFIESNLCDKVTISDNEYVLTYLNKDLTSADTIINGETMYFDIKTEEKEDGKMHPVKAVLSNKIYYKDSESENGVIKVNYGIKNIDKDGYSITEYSGVTINDNKYPVIDYGKNTDGDKFYVIPINEKIKITLEITDVNGSSTYIAYPVIDNDTIDEITENELQREYSNIIVNNWKSFSFTIRKDTFGDKPITVENGLMDSMTATLPYSISNSHLLEKEIELFRMQNYLSFKFPLSNRTANNLRREDIIKEDFVDYIRSESVNTIVDMEKDVYYPVWKKNNEFKPIQQIRFNLHFRTRNFENWKIYEDDREFKNVPTPNYQKSNWFVTDLDYYKNDCHVGDDNNEVAKKLHNASDLLGFMNFTTDEIKNQATKIGKSFLRLSFYSTNDPKTQVLLATSTIFLDENMAYKKYISSKRNSDLIYADVKVLQESSYTSFTQYMADTSPTNQVSANTVSNSSEVYLDKYFNDESRLSSRFVVNDKYNTDTSSEGYYIYMFKDYSMKMREATIYMKVDFNHAGIGKTMAFMLPRIISDEKDVDGSEATPLYLHNKDDIEKLKNGFKLTDIYKQTHIPIKVMYDDKSNKYVYYLPDALRENTELGVDDEIMEFNLFEVKFANESIVENAA